MSQPVPGFGPPAVQIGITPSDTLTIETQTSGAIRHARGLNIATAGLYTIHDLSGNETTVYLTAGYNPCPCTLVKLTGAAASTGVVACY